MGFVFLEEEQQRLSSQELLSRQVKDSALSPDALRKQALLFNSNLKLIQNIVRNEEIDDLEV